MWQSENKGEIMLYLVVYLFDRYASIVKAIGMVSVFALFITIAAAVTRIIYHDLNPKG